MSKLNVIKELINPILDANNAFLVDIEIQNGSSGKILGIFIDTDEGISTQKCADISRQISKLVDNESIFSSRYHLVVSSPGIERGLKYFRQYRRNIGRVLNLKVRLSDQQENIKGVLEEVTEESIKIRITDTESKQIRLDSIIEAMVEIPW
ncbi:MAG: hypothetical protein HY964_06115 [Ignavibacteriales bacterium]|nr:hypothetical protein [Ignavibacteriales bacterium]